MVVTSTTTLAAERAARLRHLILASVTGEVGTASDAVTDDVVGWSPTLFVTSRDELLAAFEERLSAFTDIDVDFPTLEVVGNRAFAEWHVSADFTEGIVVGDTEIPPTGTRVHLAGATFADFDGGRIRAFRHYFDDAALLEQLLDLT